MGRSTDISAAYDAAAVTPNDSTIIRTTRSLFIGGTGNVNVRMASGATVLFTGVPAGVFTVQVDKVLSTSTTATNIVALY